MSEDGEVPVSESINGNEAIAKDTHEEPAQSSEEPLTPHPFYDHCGESVKRFIVAEILPLARQYAVTYHSHEVSEESKEPYKHAYEARNLLQTCLDLTSSIIASTEDSEWEQGCVERDRSCLQMLRNFIQYQIGIFITDRLLQ